jgi:hypothetical protein
MTDNARKIGAAVEAHFQFLMSSLSRCRLLLLPSS